MGSTAVAIFTLLAVAELVADRIVLGGLSGAFAGYEVRTRFVRALNVRDLVRATLEYAVAIAAGLLIVARF
jgi:uncharacterized membrane protein